MKLEVGDEIRSPYLSGFDEWQLITAVNYSLDRFQCNQMSNLWWFATDQFEVRGDATVAPAPTPKFLPRVDSPYCGPLLLYVNLQTLEEHLPFMVKTLRKYRDGETLQSTAEYKQLCKLLEKFP